jgi:hypothetical protein
MHASCASSAAFVPKSHDPLNGELTQSTERWKRRPLLQDGSSNDNPNARNKSYATHRYYATAQQVELLLGYKRGELVGQSIEILVPEGFRPKHPELHAKFVAAPVTRPLRTGRTLQARRKDGSSF